MPKDYKIKLDNQGADIDKGTAAFYEKYNANPFRGVYELAEFATEHYEEARAAVAELLHANTDEIVLYYSTYRKNVNQARK